MDLSIVVVTWNRRALLRECLASVYSQTRGIEFEVIVVDNGSTDGTAEMVRGEFPLARLRENAENLGFSKGSNQGMKMGSGRYLAVLNNDTVLEENAFHKLISFLDSHPEVGVVGPRLVNPGGTVQESALATFVDVKSALLGGKYLSRFLRRLFPSRSLVPEMVIAAHEQEGPLEVAWVVGACMLARREVLETAGLFDERIFMYGEDMEWCYRVRKTGWAVFFYPGAGVVHLDHLPTKDSMERVVSQQMANQIYFYGKHNGALAAFLLGGSLFLGSLLKLPAFLFLYSACRVADREAKGRLEFKLRFHFHALKYFFHLPFSRVWRILDQP